MTNFLSSWAENMTKLAPQMRYASKIMKSIVDFNLLSPCLDSVWEPVDRSADWKQKISALPMNVELCQVGSGP